MANLKHLTKEEREKITVLHAQYYSLRQIAKEIGRSPATISREINRKEAAYFRGVYLGAQTHNKVKELWSKTHNQKKKLYQKEVKLYIFKALKNRWSPETIAGRLKNKFGIQISHSTIYRFIHNEKTELKKYLLRPDFKRKGNYTRPNKSLVPNRVDISERPQEANERLCVGHFEGDTVLSSRKSKHNLLVMVDRKSRKTHIKRVVNKTSLETNKKIKSILTKYPKFLRKSITFDNGTEFFGHQTIKEDLEIETYFCSPYSAWQKGTVENINGLIRRFFPKGTDFDLISDAQLQKLEDWINNRPMKVLNFKTPNEVFEELTGVTIAKKIAIDA